MKRTMMAIAILAITLSAGVAGADGRDGRDGRDDRRDDRGNQHRNEHRNHRNEQRDNRGQDWKNDRHEGRGGGPDHSFYRGDRLPYYNRHRQYVVDDWRGHNLRAPPRGYHWVQSGADYLLVAVATGVILDLMLYH